MRKLIFAILLTGALGTLIGCVVKRRPVHHHHQPAKVHPGKGHGHGHGHHKHKHGHGHGHRK